MRRITAILICLLLMVGTAYSGMVLQGPAEEEVPSLIFTPIDLTSGFTEVDLQGYITSVTADQVTWVDMTRQYNSWRVRDFGSAFWDGDFTFRFTINASNATASSYPQVFYWALGNVSGDTWDDWSGDGVGVRGARNNGGSYKIRLYLKQNGSDSSDESAAITEGVDYFISVAREDATNTYTAVIRTESETGPVFDTLTQVGSGAYDLRYLYAPTNVISGEPVEIDGYIKTLKYVEEIE